MSLLAPWWTGGLCIVIFNVYYCAHLLEINIYIIVVHINTHKYIYYSSTQLYGRLGSRSWHCQKLAA